MSKGKIRISTGSLIRAYPKLLKMSKGEARKQISRMLKKSDKDGIRSVCECVSLGLSTLRPDRFNERELRSLVKKKELLRFISQAAQCRRKFKQQGLRKKLDGALIKSGKGIGLILSIVLPALLDLIIKK